MSGRGTVYNKLYDEETWEKVSRENKELLEGYIDYMKASDSAESTLHQYFQVVRLFLCWNYKFNNDTLFVELKKRHLVKFFCYMNEDMKCSPNRIAMVKSVLSSFSNYIETVLDDEYEDFTNIITKLKTPVKQPIREKTVVDEKELKKCLNTLTKQGKLQAACYLALAAASGARKQELLRFKVDYFKPENIVFGCLYKTPEKIKTKGRGSTGKLLNKYVFVNMFQPYFDRWMAYRKEHNIECEWLFIKGLRDGNVRCATTDNADDWCTLIGHILGRPFYSHSMRHYWTTMCTKANLPTEIIRELQGWNSTEMCSLYSDIDTADLLGDFFDENGIKQNNTQTNMFDSFNTQSNKGRKGR